MTTLYLHAREVSAKPDKNGMVSAGTPLGIQGEEVHQYSTKPHVHIEVHEGEVTEPVSHANHTTINPIPYLYNWVADRVERGGTDRTGRGGADGGGGRERRWDSRGREH